MARRCNGIVSTGVQQRDGVDLTASLCRCVLWVEPGIALVERHSELLPQRPRDIDMDDTVMELWSLKHSTAVIYTPVAHDRCLAPY